MCREEKSSKSCSLTEQEFIEQIYDNFGRLMYFIARKYTLDAQECEDVVQDSLTKLIEKIDTLRKLNRPALAAYIVVTIRNTSINAAKKMSREKVLSLESLPAEVIPSSSETLDDNLILGERIRQMQKIWSQLDQETRQILEGKYILEYNDKELGKMLGCKPSSVRMKLTRARRMVREKLKAGEENDKS